MINQLFIQDLFRDEPEDLVFGEKFQHEIKSEIDLMKLNEELQEFKDSAFLDSSFLE